MMKCGESERELACLFDDHRMVAGDRELRIHLASCADCRELFANSLLVRALVKVARGSWGRYGIPYRRPGSKNSSAESARPS
jgi:hypothetical protein